jgi:hypothetical protein
MTATLKTATGRSKRDVNAMRRARRLVVFSSLDPLAATAHGARTRRSAPRRLSR